MTAVFANGHWRRRDALEGLNAGMRAALIFATDGPLTLSRGRYRALHGKAAVRVIRSVAPATVRGLAERGLLRLSAGDEGRLRRFVLTAAGDAVVAEIRLRAEVRAKLLRDARVAYEEARR